MKVLILTSIDGDWQGLYIDGKLIDQGEVLGEGDSQMYMLKTAEKYDFKSTDVIFETAIDEDDEYLIEQSVFPLNLNELKGMY